MAKTAKKTAKKSTAKSAVKSKAPANAMDYRQHDDTYELFLWLSNWTIVACIALLVAMCVGFYAGGGLFGGSLVFVILMVIAFFIL